MTDIRITATNGAATLDIRFGGDYSEIFLGDLPLALTWSINDGSVIDHLIQFQHPDGLSNLKHWREALEGCSDEATILNLASPMLAPGSYRTIVTDYYHPDACLADSPTDSENPAVFYGGGFSLETTLPDSELSEERISHYERMIRDGQRPLAIALCCFDERFSSADHGFPARRPPQGSGVQALLHV